MNTSVSKLSSADLNSLIFELSRLILAHIIRRGTALSSRSLVPPLVPTDTFLLYPPPSFIQYSVASPIGARGIFSRGRQIRGSVDESPPGWNPGGPRSRRKMHK